ncbi:MAG: hypothetical protein Kow0059_10540 [Candidatus Sumerlaeia bacterium]
MRWELASRRQVFVPDFFRAAGTTSTQVVVFFHGAAWCAEQTFYEARKNAVLLTVNSVGEGDFEAMGGQLPGLLEALEHTLAENGVTTAPLGRLCVASFSGGYTAVKSILENPSLSGRVSVVVLADSLYGPRVPGREDALEPAPLEPFLRHARRAARGEPGAEFWFTHLYPPEPQYRNNKTTLAASWLIDQVGAGRKAASECNSRGARLLYRADLRGFHVLGYAGMTTQDHFEHFYAFGDLLRATGLASAP